MRENLLLLGWTESFVDTPLCSFHLAFKSRLGMWLPRKPFMVWRAAAQRRGMKEASGHICPVSICPSYSVFGTEEGAGVTQR